MDSCMRPEAKKAKRWVNPFFLFFVLFLYTLFIYLFLIIFKSLKRRQMYEEEALMFIFK